MLTCYDLESYKRKNSTLTAEEADIIKEMVNICVGNSTSIPSQLLGGAIDVYLLGKVITI